MSNSLVDSDSESDSDLEAYTDVAADFLSVVNKLKEDKSTYNTSPKKRKIPSPEKKKPENLEESIDLDDDSNLSATNLDDDSNASGSKVDDTSANLSTSIIEDSPIIIEDENSTEMDGLDDVPLNSRVSRLRPRRGGRVAKPPKRKNKKSPKKKLKTIECDKVDLSLLEDDDDSFVLSQGKDTPDDPNPQMLVKTYWRFKELIKVPVRKFQKISVIFERFSELEKVPISRIQICLNGKILTPDETPDSLNLKISDILDGGILSEETSDTPKTSNGIDTEPPNSIPIKIMRKDVREPLIMKIKKTDKMMILIVKVGEELSLAADQFKLYFDGEPLDPEDTPDSLDLEGNECFDLKVKS